MATIAKQSAKTEKRAPTYRGLTEREARRRLDEHGPNTLVTGKKVSPLKIFFDQFRDFMVIILLVSTAVSAFMGDLVEAVTIIAIVILNAVLGFIQEFRTEKTLDALRNLAAPTAKVIRDGKRVVIPAQLVVPGDLVELEAGDRIPADGRVIECKNFFVDESLLTGESLPVEKTSAPAAGSADRNNSVFMGTMVTGGRCMAYVTATGMDTEMGKIAGMIEEIEDEQTPLQKRLEHLGKFIAIACLGICAVVTVTGILRGEALFTMLLSGISLAVAAVPEGLPAIVTISLALGVQRMLRRNALVRKLPTVETLGCATVICSDKTGTLTENKMTVRRIYTADGNYDVSGIGFEPVGEITQNGRKLRTPFNRALSLLLETGVLCNNSILVQSDSSADGVIKKLRKVFSDRGKWTIQGDPTEGALLVVAAKAGVDEKKLSEYYRRIDEIPFDSDRKCMTVICADKKGDIYVFTKGAADVIINKCSRIMAGGEAVLLDSRRKAAVLAANERMAGDALRVLGFAYKKLSDKRYTTEQLETDLVFLGLAGMIDPPRKEAFEAVQKCKLAGIKPVMITGDHKGTAAAIASELNIYNKGDMLLTGADLETMNETALQKVADKVTVYARVSPKHKLMIVRALKRLGHVVAMTGDGVNDAPAVKEADIGVAMGITGTDVTKEASSMILLDDNFASIVSAVEEGRVIYSNIRKFIRYLLSCNIGEVLTMFLGMILGLPIPLFPLQILWVNLVTDGLPAIALSLEPAEKDIMMQKPRGTKENIFSGGLLHLIVIRGILIGLCTLAVFCSILFFTGNVVRARTAAFLTLVLTQLIHVFECKSERKSIFEIPVLNNKALILAVSCSVAMILAVIYIPVLQPIFKTTSIVAEDWALVLGFTGIVPVAASMFRRRGAKKRT